MKPFIVWRVETVGRSEYLIHLLISALLFGGLTALYLKTGKGAVAAIADVISLLVMGEWIQCAGSRSRNAGLSRWVFGLSLSVLVILCGSLVLLNVLPWPYALVLFVITQVPLGFLRQKQEPSLDSGTSPA